MSEYLTVNEVSKLLRTSDKWVYLHKEEIPGFFKISGVILFDYEMLKNGLKKLAHKPS